MNHYPYICEAVATEVKSPRTGAFHNEQAFLAELDKWNRMGSFGAIKWKYYADPSRPVVPLTKQELNALYKG